MPRGSVFVAAASTLARRVSGIFASSTTIQMEIAAMTRAVNTMANTPPAAEAPMAVPVAIEIVPLAAANAATPVAWRIEPARATEVPTSVVTPTPTAMAAPNPASVARPAVVLTIICLRAVLSTWRSIGDGFR